MPDIEVMSPSVDSPERPSLRSHKLLPRRGIVTPIDVVQPVTPDKNATVAAPAPPLTPPGAIHDETTEDELTPRKTDSRSEIQTTGMLTPRGPSKPPTPDVTPPRTNSLKRPPLNHYVHHSSSSRAESFQTAFEGISDSDMDTPVRTTLNLPQIPRSRMPSSQRSVSNGNHAKLNYAKDTPPSASRPLSETASETGFESCNGEWAANQVDTSPTPVTGKKPPPKTRFQTNDSTSCEKDTLDVLHLDASLTREKNLRDRVRKTHDLTETPSMERFRDEIGWPSYDGTSSQPGDADSCRLSGLSSTSTVEAMIIDSPKRGQRLLRHSEKRSSLRSTSSPITKSERTSTPSNLDLQHRLVHKAARISEQDRRSISSDISFSTKTVSAPRASVDIIPVVVVPERRSSLKSGPNSQVSSRHGSQRSSRRPPVSSQGSSSGNVPRQKTRTMSDSASARPRDLDSRGRPCGRPTIPPRSSSLSAPTSRNNSRTTSLTSESLRSHTLAMDLEMQKHREHKPVSPPRHNILAQNDQVQGPARVEPPKLPPMLTSLVNNDEDMSILRPPSLPYTQWSIPSSSPGPIEIREATAVSLFPHNNRSLLLVDQQLPPGPETHTLQAFYRTGSANSIPRTPDNNIHPAMLTVESPLKNPRSPPKPPVSKPLPPLPVHDDRENRGVGEDGSGRRQGSLRRTWADRSRSNSFNTLMRSLSVKSAKNRKAGMEVDSQLHPMWRPRGFWDDIPGTSPKKGNTARHSLYNPAGGPVVNNSLGLPQSRIVIEGPPSLARRSPEMRRLFNGMPSVAHYNVSNASLVDRGFLRSGSPLYQHRYQILSRWGIRLRSLKLQNVRNRFKRLRQRRDERKRAARRENLKQSIGGPIYVASSATHEITH